MTQRRIHRQQIAWYADMVTLVTGIIMLLTYLLLPFFIIDQTSLQALEIPGRIAGDSSLTLNTGVWEIALFMIMVMLIISISSTLFALTQPHYSLVISWLNIVYGAATLMFLLLFLFQYVTSSGNSHSLFAPTHIGYWTLLTGTVVLIGQAGVRRQPVLPPGYAPQPPATDGRFRAGMLAPVAIDTATNNVPMYSSHHRELMARTPADVTPWQPFEYAFQSVQHPQPAWRPATGSVPRLVEQAHNFVYVLEHSDSTRIGRKSHINDFVIHDKSVSRQHAVLFTRGGQFYIRRMSTAAPLLVNDIPVQDEHPVQPNDTITVGNIRLQFIL